MKSNITAIFGRNRAEELGDDVWSDFVIPRYFDWFDLKIADKPRVMIGGRGCGKTMLLRYFSYQSAFSPARSNIPQSALSKIFIYLRFDTQFLANLRGRGQDDEVWRDVFSHYLGLVLSRRTLEALRTISRSSVESVQEKELENLNFSELQVYSLVDVCDISSLERSLEVRLRELRFWISNIGRIERPILVPGFDFYRELLSIIIRQVDGLKLSSFSVLFDEFENLSESQQEVINTLLKHSENPLIFHVALKPNGWKTRKTLSDELLQNVADFREVNLEVLLLNHEFNVFAAEVLALNMSKSTAESSSTVDIDLLRLPEKLEERNSAQYRSRLLEYAETLFPSLTLKEVASQSLNVSRVTERLKKRIELGLKRRNASEKFGEEFKSIKAECTLILPALLNRTKLPLDQIASELKNYGSGDSEKAESWVHNNLMGSILSIYNAYDGVCPVYGGFQTFVALANGSMRHFLELCYVTFNERRIDDVANKGTFESQMLQARAARIVSNEIVRETRHFGRMGNRLHSFVLRLGALFALAHQNVAQSEPEQNHFVVRGKAGMSNDAYEILITEAVKWSVLYEAEETKIKSGYRAGGVDYEYVLNPIYAPAFNISFRKKRKMEIGYELFLSLVLGSDDDFKNALTKISSRWVVEDDLSQMSLFRNLNV